MDSSTRFCDIINRYCESLGRFIDTIKSPTEINIEKIKNKKYRNKKMDVYVSLVDNFNILMTYTTKTIKEIILSLNELFLHKNMETLVEFLTTIQRFLEFLVSESIFDKLAELKTAFQKNKYEKIKIIEKVDTMRHIIFRIFNISVSISSVFIPALDVINPILESIEKKVIIYIDEKTTAINTDYIDVDHIIRSLLDTQLRSEIISNIDIDVIYDCIRDKNAAELLPVIENLQKEYISLLVIMVSLKSEISTYKQKKAYKIINFIHCLIGI